jgi:uncharacterized membrane protein (DUF485 family)
MNDRLIAIRKTAGQMALFLIAIVAITYLSLFLSLQVFAYTVLAAMIFGVAYILYNVNIDAIQSKRSMEESEKRIQSIREGRVSG